MSNVYVSAKGQSIDIDKIKLANEQAVAVGNMRVNARGDQIGPGNKVVAGRNQLMDQMYAVEDAPYSPNDPDTFAQMPVHHPVNIQAAADPTPTSLNELTQMLHENNVADPVRGSLASSVASKGPTRI